MNAKFSSCSLICLVFLFFVVPSTTDGNMQYSCQQIFANFPQSLQYACNSNFNFSQQLLVELLNDGRDVKLNYFITLLNNLVSNVDQSMKDTFLLNVLQLLYNQTATNPPQYVSHGTDHSVRVMDWCIRLLEIPDVAASLQMNYGLNGTNAQFVLGMMGLLHDIGYADLNQHKVPKWLHAISSGLMVQSLLNASGAIGYQLLTGVASVNVVQDFIDAIWQHNWDESFCKWTVNNSQYWSQCTFNTSGDPNDPLSKTTPILNSNRTWVRQYSFGYIPTVPLKFVVRVADNLDAIRSRLTPVQDDIRMMQYFYRIYVDEPLRIAVGSSDPNIEQYRNAARAQARIYSGLTNPNTSQADVMARADEQSYLHFYSNYIIDSSDIDSSIWSISVNLSSIDGDLNFQNHPGPGLYQINRLATSALSCIIRGNTTFLDLVRFKFNVPIPGLDGANFLPLRAFTKKPVYDIGGQVRYADGTEANICDPFCDSITISLTKSYEGCMQPSGQIDDCANISQAFSKVPPFTDLTYPPVPLSPQPTPSPAPYNSTPLEIAVIVLGVLMILSVIVIIILLVLLSKKRSQYDELK